MKIFYSSKFAREYKKLPLRIKKIAELRENIFRGNPTNTQLHTHKLKGRLKGYWAFSIDHQYRIIFEFAEQDVVWFHSIGDHAIYN